MNASHPWVDRLSEYVDGDLDAADRAGLEQHLSGCAECRSGVRELRRVRDWLGSDAIQPGDGPTSAEWSRIAQRIKPRRRLRAWGIGAGLLAAAAIIAIMVGRPQPDAGGPQGGIFPVGAPSPVYTHATDDLEAVLRVHRSRLRPETVRALETSLAMIDSAIAQAQRALAADPANDYVIRYIDRLRVSRLATLRDVVALVQL